MPGRKAPEEQRRQQILRAAFAVATRERLEGLTIRMVAEEAGLSPGLVFFHFTSREDLLGALLSWLLEMTLVADLDAPSVQAAPADGRLHALVVLELEQARHKREQIELFFDYWVKGTRDSEIRREIRAALDRYRAAFEPPAAALIASNPGRFAGVTPEGLATTAVSLIQGWAVQSILQPDADVQPFLASLRALVGLDVSAGEEPAE